MSIQAKVGIDKQEHPERYCPERGCLWRIQTRDGYSPCGRHAPTSVRAMAKLNMHMQGRPYEGD